MPWMTLAWPFSGCQSRSPSTQATSVMYSVRQAIFIRFSSVSLPVHEEQGMRHRVVGAQRWRMGFH